MYNHNIIKLLFYVSVCFNTIQLFFLVNFAYLSKILFFYCSGVFIFRFKLSALLWVIEFYHLAQPHTRNVLY